MEVEQYTFKELLSRIVDNRGRTCPTAETGTALIATNCIKDDQLYPVFEKVRWVDQETIETWFRGHPKPGDILFVLKGSPGRCCLVPDPINFCIAQDMLALRADESKVSQKFLFALLRSSIVRSEIDNLHVGTMIPHFKKGDFDQLTFQIPKSRKIQDWIGEQYFILSDKIELNRRMNATLEGMAQALFKSWFVDFDPVIDNALAAGNPIPDELAPRAEIRRQALATNQQGMFDEPTLLDRKSLFPSAFRKSESMGWIPEGWEETNVGNHVSLQRGTTYKSMLKGLPGPYLLGLGTIQRNGGFKEGKLMTYGGDSPAKITIGPGDIFVSLKDLTQAADLLGSVARIPPHIPSGRLTQDTVALVFDKGPISRDYLYNALLTPRYRDYCRNYSTGTTNLGLAREDFFSYPVPKPDGSVQDLYDNFVSANQNKHQVNTAQVNSLTKLRDTLLPKLISGELHTSDAEQHIKEARS